MLPVHRHASHYRLSLSAVLIGMVSLIAIDAAHAQDTGETMTLDAITIEGRKERGDGPVKGYVARQSKAGTKTDTPIAKTPQSIAVVSKEQMQDQNVQSVAEALRYTPGVFADYRGASNLRDELFVRGFYYVPRYLDGLYLGGDLSYAKMDPYLLERVELLSGPSSILYGQANPGGIVNMVSKKPIDEPLREIGLTVGTNGHLGLSFDFSDKFQGSDTLSYRLVGSGLGKELQEDFTKQRSFAIAPSVTWSPDAQTTLTVLGGYQNEPNAGFRNFLDAAGTVFPIEGYGYVPRDFFVSDPDYEKFTREQAWIGYEFEHVLNDTFTMRQNARFHHLDTEHHTLIWGSASANPATGAYTEISRLASGGTESWNTFTIDNQAEAKFDTGAASHTLLAGLDYRYMARDYNWGRSWGVPTIDLTNPQYGGFDYGSVVLTPSDIQELTAKQTGIYLQDQIEIGRFNLMAGLRHDWASTDIDDQLGSNDQDYTDSAFTWRAGGLYSFDNGIAPYMSYATSFEPSLYLPSDNQNAFKPTTAGQFEVGVKYAPDDMDLLLTAAFYDLRQNDVVMGAWNGSVGRTVYSQIGEIHNQGVELSARASLNENFSLVASYAYTKSKIIDSVTTDEVGKTPARIPEHQASVWGKYEFGSGTLEGLTLGAGLRYLGKSWGNNTNTFEVPAATLFDAAISYDFGAVNPEMKGLSLQVNAKNIADKTYVASCASAYACFYGEGRSLSATVKRTW
ncbi:TonB-dependent siderophore receptor [Mesorhizobium sp. SB112]|uniref:TonB-dependent siderophore receptor n=1 Tax=Mesorhizobium sp. SB112 TaxID=3151853 RepID=UPI0032674013